MIEVKFTLDPELGVYEQLLNYVAAFAPHANEMTPEPAEETPEVTRVTPSTPVETEPTEPKKRGRKAKESSSVAKESPVEPLPIITDPQDAVDEIMEDASDVLTHDDVRSVVGEYTKLLGIVAAQKNIPAILGGAIADIPNDPVALQNAIWKIQKAMAGDSTGEKVSAVVEVEAALFDEPASANPLDITESDVRDAMMLYAKKYDVDDKMANTLIDGSDILKKTFGPTVSALRLIPKDPESLKKAYDAIHDAIANNWYNRKVVR
jgi:hypothetical protein